MGARERDRGGDEHGEGVRGPRGCVASPWRRLGAPGRSQAGREGGGGRRGAATRLRPSGEGGRRQGGGGGGLGRCWAAQCWAAGGLPGKLR